MGSYDPHSASKAVVETCQALGLPFEQRIQFYRAIVETLTTAGVESYPLEYPDDPAWALVTSTNPEQDGRRDAEIGSGRRWAYRQLLKAGHRVALRYEEGYKSVPREIAAKQAKEAFHFLMERWGTYQFTKLVQLARAVLALQDTGTILSPEEKVWVLTRLPLGMSLESLLELEDAGRL